MLLVVLSFVEGVVTIATLGVVVVMSPMLPVVVVSPPPFIMDIDAILSHLGGVLLLMIDVIIGVSTLAGQNLKCNEQGNF